MVDTKLLNDKFSKSGITKKHLSEMLSVTRPTLDAKLDGRSDITAAEIPIFCAALQIGRQERESIFFAK